MKKIIALFVLISSVSAFASNEATENFPSDPTPPRPVILFTNCSWSAAQGTCDVQNTEWEDVECNLQIQARTAQGHTLAHNYYRALYRGMSTRFSIAAKDASADPIVAVRGFANCRTLP